MTLMTLMTLIARPPNRAAPEASRVIDEERSAWRVGPVAKRP